MARLGVYSRAHNHGVAGVDGLFSPAASTCPSSMAAVSDCAIGIPPGDACYDATHDNGKVHCGSGVDSLFFSNVVTACSASEQNCAQGVLKQINPPSVPQNYNPQTGEANPGTTLTPAPATPSDFTCADGTQPPCNTNESACAWYCNLPFASSLSPTYGSDCMGCAPSGLSSFLIIGSAVVLGLIMFAAVKR